MWPLLVFLGGESICTLQQSELDNLRHLHKKSRFKKRRFLKPKMFRGSISSIDKYTSNADSLSIASSARQMSILDASKLQNALAKSDNNEMIELEEKLKPLANLSNEFKNINVISINVTDKGITDKAVQTSLTDLSGVGRKTAEVQEASIQCNILPVIDTTTTTSSSQTEEKGFLKYPIGKYK